MQSKEIIATLENEDAKEFISSHIDSDLAELGLKYSNKFSFNITLCLQLMQIYKKAKYKLPLFVSSKLALDMRSYEQSTSQAVAVYKRTFMKGHVLLDLTAGIGVDTLFLSENFTQVIAVERNEFLHDLAVYNNQKLEVFNIKRLCVDATQFEIPKVDWVYIDPDRRPGEKRVVALEKLEPNVKDLLPKLQTQSMQAYIKLSPLYDVDEVWREFNDAVQIVILAENNEVKEVGVILCFSGDVRQKSIHLADVVTGFRFDAVLSTPNHNQNRKESNFKYLLIPNALLVKSRLHTLFFEDKAVSAHPSFHYYFSNELLTGTGFRSFRILKSCGFNKSEIKKHLHFFGVGQVNIVIKGLKDKPIDWHKKLNTRDGGTFYLFLLKGQCKEAIICEFIYA